LNTNGIVDALIEWLAITRIVRNGMV
jgi:hypothetical protein